MKLTVFILIIASIVFLSAKYPHLMLNPGDLIEGHQKIKNDCAACHKPFWGIESNRCISCHKPEEIGMNVSSKNNQSEKNEVILFHDKLKNLECSTCHTDHNGLHPLLKMSSFDHEMLSSEIKTNCISCHGKPLDNLHDQLSVSCNSCHNTNNWKFSGSFDHNMITGVNKADCNSCHAKPEDLIHESLKDNCGKCHSTDKWLPSTLDHSPFFVLDKDHNDKCITCHKNNNFSTYTCYGCHEHSENKIMGKHQEHGIYDFTDCASCHRSGDEHDINGYDKNKNELNKSDIENNKEFKKSGKDREKDNDDDD